MVIAHIGLAKLPLLFNRGGAIEKRIMNLAIAQAEARDQVILYSSGDGETKALNDLIEIRYIKCLWPEKVHSFEFLLKCVADASRKNIDVLHFHSQPEGALLAKNARARKFLTYDYYKFRRGRWNPLHFAYSRLLMRFDRLLPVSDFCLRQSVGYWGFPEEKAAVIYNGVDTRIYKPDRAAGLQLKSELGLRESVILYVGRICRQKGTDILLKAYEDVSKRRNDVSLVIAGPSDRFGNSKTNSIVSYMNRVGARYLGAVDESLLPILYNCSDVVVVPTRTLEMFGMVAVEAQACGKPVIASDHGGLREVISARSGRFIRVGDSAGLARELHELLDNHSLAESMSKSARQNALRYDWKVVASELREQYLR